MKLVIKSERSGRTLFNKEIEEGNEETMDLLQSEYNDCSKLIVSNDYVILYITPKS